MRIIADAREIDRLVAGLADQIAKASTDPKNLAIIGIRRRGDVLGAKIAQRLGIKDVGSIDITLYRDDLSETGPAARVGRTQIPFSVEGREVVLVDDVIMTGRSVMAALREILDFGRPSRIRLAVLVERPEREIPIEPEHAALKVSPAMDEKVDVRLVPQDEMDRISINPKG